MPVHGEACHLRAHAELAVKMGVPEKNIFVLDNGDTLEMRHGKVRRGRAVESGVVYVDGKALDEPYVNEPVHDRENFEGKITVPEGCVFVMGDNRNASTDSRDARLGCVDDR